MWRRFKVVHHAVDEVEPGDRDDEEDGGHHESDDDGNGDSNVNFSSLN